MFKKIRNLEPGDQVLHRDGTIAYTILAISDRVKPVVPNPGALNAEIEWADGARDWRIWDEEHLDQTVLVGVAT